MLYVTQHADRKALTAIGRMVLTPCRWCQRPKTAKTSLTATLAERALYTIASRENRHPACVTHRQSVARRVGLTEGGRSSAALVLGTCSAAGRSSVARGRGERPAFAWSEVPSRARVIISKARTVRCGASMPSFIRKRCATVFEPSMACYTRRAGQGMRG